MDQQQVLSKETMEKYLELQQMFEQLNSAELQQALKQMQQAMQNLNKEQLQQAMQKLTFSEDRFRQSIERTIELLKRIQIEQKIDEARKRAQELEQTQKELSQETSKAANDDQKRNELAKKQNDLAEKQRQLEQETADVQKRMEEFFTEMPADRMHQLNAQMQTQQLGQKMNKASKQMQAGQMQQAQESQQQLEQQLQDQSKQLQSIQQEMLQKQMQQTLSALRRATNDMLELSKREESLKQQAQTAPTNSPQLRQNAQDQMRAMQDMQNVIRGLGELSKRSFAVTPEIGRSIGEAMAHMKSSLEALEGRNGYGASQEEGQSMSSLNKTATQLQGAMQNMMQSGGSGMGGLLQQLQMMAGQQQGINAQTQSMQQAAEAARLAVEQEAVRKSLEQLNKEAQASGEQKKMLGDLDKIAEEMKEVVQNLAQNNVNPETLRKQERILSRLLDASKSMRERDYEKKRKATTGTQVVRRGPNDLDPSLLEGKNKLLEDLLKSLEHGYSKDYQELIRKYFDALQKLEGQKQ
jgi:myosin heavy subunit